MKKALPLMIGVSLALAAAAGASAQVDSSQQVKLEIPSQLLRDALNDWAQQTGFNLISPTSPVTSQFVVPSISGQLTARAALERLLAGTSLTYELLDSRTVVIKVKSRSSVSATGWRKVSNDSREHIALLYEDQQRGEGNVAQAESSDHRSMVGATSIDKDAKRNLDEILVTAQKRQERLQDVPMSITALSGTDLDRAPVEGAAEALNSVPGVLTLQNWNGQGMRVAVRGVGSTGAGSSPIGYYLDSVPFAAIRGAFAPDADAYDLERVEVLRGPQGTLYGASSLNGVVRILTHEPSLDKFEWKARGLGSSTEGGEGNYRADMSINVPLIQDRLAARVTGGYENLSGWIDRPNDENANNMSMKTFRGKLKAQVTERFTADWSTWLSRNHYDAPNTGSDGQRNSSTASEPSFADYDLNALKLNYDADSFSVMSTSSYLNLNFKNGLDFRSFCGSGCSFLGWVDVTTKVFAQEIVATSSGDGPWKWSLGTLYRDNRDATKNFTSDLDGNPFPGFFWDDRSKSIALYGQLTRLLLDGRLELTAGLRGFHDEVTTLGSSLAGGTFADHDTFQKVTKRISMVGHISNDWMAYFTYSQGFRSGVLQNPLFSRATSGQPDVLSNYEIGAKGDLWNGALSFDGAVYYIDWQRQQQQLAVQFGDGGVGPLATNGVSASGVGIDLAVTAHPTLGLSIGISLSVNNLKQDADTVTADGVLYREGERLDDSAKETYGAFVDYQFPIGTSGYKGTLSTSARYSSRTSWRSLNAGDNLVVGYSDPQTITRVGFSVHAPKNWDAEIYADNLNNEQGISGPQPFNVSDWAARPRPRTYGLQLEYHFDK